MSKIYLHWFLILTTFFFFTGCGGGDGDGETEQQITPNTSISGTVSVVDSQIALFENKNLLTRLASLLVADLQAAVTGLTPLPNASVELIRIDDSGNQVGDVIDTSTTDDNGAYVLETTESLSSELVVQITDNAGNKVRAIALSETTDINPVTEYVVQQILQSIAANAGFSLDAVTVDTVTELVNFVEALPVDVTDAASLDDTIAAIDTTADAEGIDTEVNNGLYSLDLAGRTASSVMTSSDCTDGTAGGFIYSFTSTGITMTGSDSFISDGFGNCTLGAEETFSLTHGELQTFEDFVYCGNQHLCTYSDLNKEVTGVDGDNRSFVFTVSHVANSDTVTVVKTASGTTFTEVITLDPVTQ
jgi:hypothetical protein